MRFLHVLALLFRTLLTLVRGSASASIYNREDFILKAPDFLDCTGPLFDPVWDEWYKAVVDWENAINGVLSEGEDGASNFAVSDSLQRSGAHVAEMAHNLLADWFPHLQAINGTGIDKVIRGFLQKEDLNGVCYYGIIQALWVRAQLIMLQGSYSKQREEAMLELRTAMSILGHDFRADYIDSTRWLVSGLEIKETLQKGVISRAPGAKGLKVVNIPTDMGNAWALSPPVDFFKAPIRGDIAKSRTDLLKVAAFGQHVSLLAEPVNMIRGALPEFQVLTHWYLAQCRWRDPMHHYMCRLHCLLVGECHYYDDYVNLGRKILRMVEYVAEGHVLGDEEELKGLSRIPQMLDVAAQLWDEDVNLQSTHLIVCTVPLVCSLLRSVCPLPMLGYFSMSHYTNPSYDVGTWGMLHWAEMVKNTAQNAFAVSNPLLQDIAIGSMAVRPPSVRPFGLYAYQDQVQSLFPEPFAKLHDNVAAYDRTVVIPRSRTAMQTSWMHALRWFVEAVDGFPLNFTIVRGSIKSDINMAWNPHPRGEPIGDLMGREENVFIDSKTMMLYRCAILIPQSASMMSIYERHSMHLPTFVAGVQWIWRLGKQGAGFYPSGKEFKADDPAAPAPSPAGPKRNSRPFTGVMFDPGTVWHLSGLTRDLFHYDRRYETRLPGIVPFESYPQLLELLLFEDLPRMRERMRQSNEEELRPVLRWYRTAVMHLMGGPPHHLFGAQDQ